MSQIDDEQDGGAGSGKEPDSELLVGIMLFFAGCLPAASMAKALFDGTDLASDGLTGTASLAANIASLVGPWPALLVSVAVTVIGTLMVLGTLRREPMRFVGGSLVSGLGLTAIASAISLGAGGRLGDGTGGALGSVAGVVLGMAVIGAALWLTFIRESAPAAQPELEMEPGEDIETEPEDVLELGGTAEPGPFDDAGLDDENEVGLEDGVDDDIEDDATEERPSILTGVGAALTDFAARLAELPGALRKQLDARSSRAGSKQGALKEGEPRPSGSSRGGSKLGRTVERHNRVAAQPRRQSEPQTLSAALVRDDVEGVSHDEAAALAPDEKTLEYMENVWRRANTGHAQAEPIPPSPYPEDVRLKGEVPPGAKPFLPLDDGASVEDTSLASAAPVIHPLTGAPAGIPGGPVAQPIPNGPSHADDLPQDIAPFDFVNEQAASELLGNGSSEDPFGAAESARPLSSDDEAALAAAVLREGASSDVPRTLPAGVHPLTPTAAESDEIPSVGDLLAEAESLTRASVAATDDVGAAPPAAYDDLALPPELTPPPPASWEVAYDEAPVVEPVVEPVVDPVEEAVIPDVDNSGHWPRRDGDDPAPTDEVEAAEIEVDEDAPDEDVEVEAEEEDETEEAEVDEAEVEEAEVEEAEADEEEEEFEYVDEDGNPIDPAELDEYETDEDPEEEGSEEEEEDEDDDDDDGEEEAEYEEEDGEAEYEEVDGDEEEEEVEDAKLEEEADEKDDPTDPAFEADAANEYEDADAESGEPSVVLEPQAPPEGTSRDASRVLEAGRIVVREGRVAVSLLQRELEMEFDAACELLDQLQAEGLIGPYKGGKKRDILLSGEEWEGRFVRS